MTVSRSRRHGIYKTRHAAGASAALVCVCVCARMCVCVCVCLGHGQDSDVVVTPRLLRVPRRHHVRCVCVCARKRVLSYRQAPIDTFAIRVTVPGDPSHDTRHGSESRFPVIRVARGGRVLGRRRRRRRGRGACLYVRGRMAGGGPRPAHHRPSQRAFIAFFAYWSAYRAGDVSGRGRDRDEP